MSSMSTSIFRLLVSILMCTYLILTGCAAKTRPPGTLPPEDMQFSTLEEKWGVHIEGIRLSAAGYMLDFRYRILDPEKAAPLVDRRIPAYCLDPESGAKLIVPTPAKVGPLRQTNKFGKPKTNRIYFILFANPGRLVEPGQKVTVVIGDFKAEHLTVE